MLLYQGAEAFTIWTGIDADIDAMEKVILESSGIDDLGDF